jgi:predicted enzyme related to lactoylglutathione lyase
MILRRIVPNLTVDDASTGHDFYEGFLGLRKEFDLGWVASFRSPANPSVQVSIVSGDPTAPEPSSLSVAVADVDAAYAEAQRRGYEIVHPLTHEPWGVRRFFVRDPHGIVVNVVGHAD